jgi:type IV pilus assembly protein PilO
MTIREAKRIVMVVLVILVLTDLVTLGVLVSPLAKSRQQREAELQQLQTQWKEKEREVGPSRGMDRKIAVATGDIATFYKERLPGQYSQIADALGKAAKTSGVQLREIKYSADKDDIEDLRRVQVVMTISGPYVDDVKFINSLERDRVFFVIDSVSLAGATAGVQLEVKAETYFKTGAA